MEVDELAQKSCSLPTTKGRVGRPRKPRKEKSLGKRVPPEKTHPSPYDILESMPEYVTPVVNGDTSTSLREPSRNRLDDAEKRMVVLRNFPECPDRLRRG